MVDEFQDREGVGGGYRITAAGGDRGLNTGQALRPFDQSQIAVKLAVEMSLTKLLQRAWLYVTMSNQVDPT
jgi:hypothetical protein